MGANFNVENGKIASFDKYVLLFNFDALNEVFLQGFSYSKKKIEKNKNIEYYWNGNNF